MRKAFNFYRSFYDVLSLLDDQQRGQITIAICQVMFLDKKINQISFKDESLQIAWAGIRHSLQASVEGFINKKQGLTDNPSQAPIEGGAKAPTKAPCQQEKGKEKEKGQGKEKRKNTSRRRVNNFDFSRWPEKPSSHALDGWKTVRNQKRAPLTQAAINRMSGELQKAVDAGMTVDDCLEECALRGWVGFRYEWMAKKSGKQSGIDEWLNDQGGRNG